MLHIQRVGHDASRAHCTPLLTKASMWRDGSVHGTSKYRKTAPFCARDRVILRWQVISHHWSSNWSLRPQIRLSRRCHSVLRHMCFSDLMRDERSVPWTILMTCS
jgi:hypothetical protein